MKTILISAVLLLAVLGATTAQQLTTRAYMEKTNMGLKNGLAIGFTFLSDAEAGGFFQKSAAFGSIQEQNVLSRFVEREFYGIYGAYPLLNRRVIDIKYQVRTGISNGENFIITSSILADAAVMNHVKIGGGVGMRNFRPTYQTSITIVL
jgi:hypothetical protein